MSQGLFAGCEACLAVCDPVGKCDAVAALWSDHRAGTLRIDPELPVRPIGAPGRPAQPALVDPALVPRRRLGSAEGRAALVHAVAHIEFNAINLALDAAYRFRGMPDDYYRDWLSVAADESRHFRLLEDRLRSMGLAYGDLPAHDGLWEMAAQTADSCLVRMALVPRVLEARGLDVTPGMIQRLRAAGDAETASVLDVILEEEVRHVAIGTHWFRFCCERRGLEPDTTFMELLTTRYAGAVRGPLNMEARCLAGFSDRELAQLESGGAARPAGST